tara:strand:+ start:485 stop:679 length:195 start_codon:yes stop_codon:yes gene_type:complete
MFCEVEYAGRIEVGISASIGVDMVGGRPLCRKAATCSKKTLLSYNRHETTIKKLADYSGRQKRE